MEVYLAELVGDELDGLGVGLRRVAVDANRAIRFPRGFGRSVATSLLS